MSRIDYFAFKPVEDDPVIDDFAAEDGEDAAILIGLLLPAVQKAEVEPEPADDFAAATDDPSGFTLVELLVVI